MVYRLFLKRNGLDLTFSLEDRYAAMWRLAARKVDEAWFTDWLRQWVAPVD